MTAVDVRARGGDGAGVGRVRGHGTMLSAVPVARPRPAVIANGCGCAFAGSALFRGGRRRAALHPCRRTAVHLPAGVEQADPAARARPAGHVVRAGEAPGPADARDGAPPVIAGEVRSAEETFESIENGIGIALLSAGNAEIYRRDTIVTVPVHGIAPSELAVAWRSDDHRPVIRDFVDVCSQVAKSAGAIDPENGDRRPRFGAKAG